jgi:Putative addiction module component
VRAGYLIIGGREDHRRTLRFEEIEAAAHDDEEDGIEQAWAEEIERRVREVDSGEVELIPGDEVMAEMRALL